VDRASVAEWIDGYERAWRAPGVSALAGLFTPDAVYRQGPYHEPVIGLDAIERMWERERDGPDERFTMSSEIVAVDGSTAVVWLAVDYTAPPASEYRDIWIIRFAADGRCEHFEEWPFWPDRPIKP
jgi:uncharacterized protein (TIGR02246 family)